MQSTEKITAQTQAMAAEFHGVKFFPIKGSSKVKVSFIAFANAPPSTPPISVLIFSTIPFKRLCLKSTVTWLAGKRQHMVCTVTEKPEIGINAPITKPAAAERWT